MWSEYPAATGPGVVALCRQCAGRRNNTPLPLPFIVFIDDSTWMIGALPAGPEHNAADLHNASRQTPLRFALIEPVTVAA